jgi:hypothetical protein
MHRIIFIVLLGAVLSTIVCGKNLVNDTTTKAASAANPLLSSKAPADTASKDGIDTIAVRKDTTALHALSTIDSTAIPKDTSSSATQAKRVSPPEPKNLAAAETSSDPNGYKDTHWGMTLREARKSIIDHGDAADDDIREITNGFEYSGFLAGTSALFAYQFDNERLFIVRLTPKVKAASKFDFLDSFENYRTILEAKYGKPARSGFSKVDDSYLSTIESIQLGFAKKYVLWEFDRSYIVLALVGRDKQLGIHISYVSRTIFEEMTSRIESLKLEDF